MMIKIYRDMGTWVEKPPTGDTPILNCLGGVSQGVGRDTISF